MLSLCTIPANEISFIRCHVIQRGCIADAERRLNEASGIKPERQVKSLIVYKEHKVAITSWRRIEGMESIPSQIATFHAIPCVSWRIKHTRKTDLGEDYQQRMIKMLPSIAWIVGSRNTVHQSSFIHTWFVMQFNPKDRKDKK